MEIKKMPKFFVSENIKKIMQSIISAKKRNLKLYALKLKIVFSKK